MTASLLCHHLDRSHGIVMPQTWGVEISRGVEATYGVSFPRVLKLVECLVYGCPTRSHNPGILNEHFMYMNCKAKVSILHEGQCHFQGDPTV